MMRAERNNGMKANAAPIRVSAPATRLGELQRTSLHETARPVGPASDELKDLCVLVSDEHYKHSLGIVRQLGRMGVKVSVVATSKDSLACRSRYCSEVIPA